MPRQGLVTLLTSELCDLYSQVMRAICIRKRAVRFVFAGDECDFNYHNPPSSMVTDNDIYVMMSTLVCV